MSPHASASNSAQRNLRQTAHAPRESDGVGNALRQIFSGAAAMPSDFGLLISRLDKQD